MLSYPAGIAVSNYALITLSAALRHRRSVAVQAANLLNQSRLFAISDAARSRLNTLFIAGNFIGGPTGSVATTVLWSIGGWSAVCLAGACLALVGLGIWTLGRRGPLVIEPTRS